MPRSSAKRALACTVVALATLACTPMAARADVCDWLDTGPIPNPAQAGCEAVETAGKAASDPREAVKDVVTAPIQAAGDEVMRGVTTWVGNGAAWLVEQAGTLIDQTTTPRIESPWFVGQYETMAGLAGVFALPLLFLAVLQGVVRRDGGLVVRAAFVQLPLAFLLAAMAVTVVQLFLRLTDEMSAAVAASVGEDAREFFKDTGAALAGVMVATGGAPVPLFAVFLGALIAAGGAFVVWLELLVRSAAIYVAVLFLPFTFVAMIWPATARWSRRLVEILLAVIFAKFVIVAIMAVAAAGLGQSRSEDAFQGVLAGAALMLLAAFSPFVLLRLIPFAESAVASAAGARAALAGGAVSPVASSALVMRRVMDSNWGSGSRGGSLHSAPAMGAAGASGVAAPIGMAAAGGLSAAQALGGAVRSRAEGIGQHASLGATAGDGGSAADRPHVRPGSAGGAASAPGPPSPKPPSLDRAPARPERPDHAGGPPASPPSPRVPPSASPPSAPEPRRGDRGGGLGGA